MTQKLFYLDANNLAKKPLAPFTHEGSQQAWALEDLFESGQNLFPQMCFCLSLLQPPDWGLKLGSRKWCNLLNCTIWIRNSSLKKLWALSFELCNQKNAKVHECLRLARGMMGIEKKKTSEHPVLPSGQFHLLFLLWLYFPSSWKMASWFGSQVSGTDENWMVERHPEVVWRWGGTCLSTS